MHVAVHYNRSAGPAKEVVDAITAAGGEAFALQGDVRDTEAIRRVVRETVARLGGIDVLVNNAGSLVKRVPIADFDDALFDEVLHINARSVLAFCREVVPLMRAQGRGGSIINVSSVAARHGGGPAPTCMPAPRASSARRPAAWPRSLHSTASASTRWRRA